MKKKLLSVLAFHLCVLPMLAKDCQSRLLPNLRPVGESPWSWGAELRGAARQFSGSGYWFYGLAAALAYESDTISALVQGEYKEKKYSSCQLPDEPSPFKLKRLSLDWRLGRFTLSAGRQEVSAGLGLGLDDFFDGVRAAYRGRRVRAEFGALVLAPSVAREALGCQQCYFCEYTSSWKGLKDSAWSDDKLLYADVALKSGSHSLGLLYLKSIAREELFDFQQLNIYAALRLPLDLKLDAEISGQRFDHGGDIAYGHLLVLSRNLAIPGTGSIGLKLVHLYGSTAGNVLFTPLYGNVTLGERMHYSVRQGGTWGGALHFQPGFVRGLLLELQYYQNGGDPLSAPLSREWDAGVRFAFDRSKRYQAAIGYQRTLLAGSTVQQITAEIRIVF